MTNQREHINFPTIDQPSTSNQPSTHQQPASTKQQSTHQQPIITNQPTNSWFPWSLDWFSLYSRNNTRKKSRSTNMCVKFNQLPNKRSRKYECSIKSQKIGGMLLLCHEKLQKITNRYSVEVQMEPTMHRGEHAKHMKTRWLKNKLPTTDKHPKRFTRTITNNAIPKSLKTKLH